MGCLWHCFNHLLSAIYSWTSLSHSVPDSLPSSKNDLTGSAGTATPSHGWFIQSLGLPHDLKNNHNNNNHHHHHDISMYCVVRISVCACSYIVQIFVIPWPRPCLAHEQTLGAAQGDVRHLLTSGFSRAIRMPQFRLGIYMICPYIMLLYIYIFIYLFSYCIYI
jgi:hypothetical protein